MADSIRPITATELSRITGVSRSTRVSWVEREAIEEPESGDFEERHVVETAIFACLVGRVEVGLAQAAWLDARDLVLGAALKGPPGNHKRFDLLINAQTAALDLVGSDREIGRVARQRSGEPHVVIPLARSVNGARSGYWRYVRSGKAAKRRVRKAADQAKRKSA